MRSISVTHRSIFALLALLALLLSACAAAPDDTIERYAEAAPADGGSIAIPGFEALTFQAESRTQRVNFTNPPENPCVFVLTLTLEDGTALWTGQELAPGEVFTAITLSRALPAGEYGAVLRYECFSTQDGTPMNGAEIQLTLVVQ